MKFNVHSSDIFIPVRHLPIGEVSLPKRFRQVDIQYVLILPVDRHQVSTFSSEDYSIR